MNFTREPIIETVVTPKDGCKLVLRNSKGGDEEFIVEAVEVVSFGRSFFFRSIESSKAFLVPVTDYEILESKEARLALKNAPAERQIKIGGGREAQLRPQQQRRPEPSQEPREEVASKGEFGTGPDAGMQQQDRKRGDRRRRGRRGRGGPDRQGDLPSQNYPESRELPVESGEEPLVVEEGVHAHTPAPSEEPIKSPSFMSKLFPPPPTLIKETLSRYKMMEEPESIPEVESEKPSFPDDIFDHPISNEKDEDNHQKNE